MNYEISTVQSELLDVVGFEDQFDSSIPNTTGDVKLSTSGLVFNDGQIPYLTIGNLYSLCPKIAASDISDVDFNSWLENRLKGAITSVLNKVVTNDNRIFEQKRIYYGIGDGSKLITNSGKLVGFKFDLVKNDNLKVKLNRIGLQFTEAVTNLNFYLYNQNEQIATFTRSTTDSDFLWFDIGDVNITAEKSGSWFLYYDQSELGTAQAVNNEIYIHSNLSNFMHIKPFACESGTDFNLIDNGYCDQMISYIANLDYSIVPDLTHWIIYNKNLFANAIRYEFGLNFYKLLVTNENLRIDGNARNIDVKLIAENIYNTEINSIAKELQTEIEILRNSVGNAQVDKYSLPTDNGGLINFALNM